MKDDFRYRIALARENIRSGKVEESHADIVALCRDYGLSRMADTPDSFAAAALPSRQEDSHR